MFFEVRLQKLVTINYQHQPDTIHKLSTTCDLCTWLASCYKIVGSVVHATLFFYATVH